ncbi:MAG: HAMP domain-containing histidine kinase [Clostridia bacterium]|nr:HAMP domain-containing histidine kinase [Clostridia bacterium]
MKISKNRQALKYIILCIAVTIISIIILAFTIKEQNEQYTEKINQQIASILGEVQEEYEYIDDEKIIDILNGTKDYKKGEELLKRYGITDELSASIEVEKKQRNNILINIGILAITFIIYIAIFIRYLRQRQKRINELDMYIQKVSRKDYSINIEESSEDELNSLKNSLYKITVMLKEEAENKKIQNEAILSSVSDISHQLKTPLTSVQILLDNILESKEMDKDTRNKFLMEIVRQIKGMNFLILSLLKLSKLEAGVVEFENKEINVNKMINEVINNLDVLAELKQINIILKCPENVIIKGDYNWNKEAIQNIIKNAIEHSNENKDVKIIVEENNVYVSLMIIDEGQGIEQEELKNIFNRFYKTTNSNENSIGIGLSLSKSIIENQNGYISVDSKIGEGTTFTIKYIK